MSPLEIKILLDLYSLADPNEAVDFSIQPQHDFIFRLEALGILTLNGDGRKNNTKILSVQHDALALYYDQISKVKLPTRKWTY